MKYLWKCSHPCFIMHKHQHSSSPLSTAPGFSFLCLCFLTILWNEVFFWDEDGPDIAKKQRKKEHGNAMLWSPNVFVLTKRELVLNTTSVENHDSTNRVQSEPWVRWGDIKEQSLCLLSREISDFVLTFSGFWDFLLDIGAVSLLLLCDSSPLLIKCHWAILWQAVKLPFKLLLQFP